MAAPAQNLIPFTPDRSFISEVEVSFLRNNEDIQAVSDLMTNLQLVVRESFGKLATIKQGQKLSSQTYGNIGNPGFSIALHLEDTDKGYLPNGYARGAWNTAAYLANKILPLNQQLTEAGIGKNIEDLKKVVDHLIIAYEKTLKLLTLAPYTKTDPAFDEIRKQILDINSTLTGSSKGIRNLLITYIGDRMPNKDMIANVFKEGSANEKKEQQEKTVLKVAICLEMIFRLDKDSDFDAFCLHKKKAAEHEEKEVISFLTTPQQKLIALTLAPLKTDLKTFFPDDDEHFKQLRSIGKLVDRILKIKSKSEISDEVTLLKKVTGNLRRVEGSNGEAGKVKYPDGTYWDESDRLYHFGEYTNETKFTPDDILSTNTI